MTPGIPKFRKKSHPERAEDRRRPILQEIEAIMPDTAGKVVVCSPLAA
jgi:hypothetical protein